MKAVNPSSAPQSWFHSFSHRIDEYLYKFFVTALSSERTLRDPEKELGSLKKDIEMANFGEQMVKNIELPFTNLALSQAFYIPLGNTKEPYFCAKLPRPQVAFFPRVLQNNLLHIEDDKLHIYFAVYVLQKEESVLTLSIPLVENQKTPIQVAFYGGEGVGRGTVPWDYHRSYTSEEIQALSMSIKSDVATFKLGAFLENCQGPATGIGVYGLVLRPSGQGKAWAELIQRKPTLQTFVETLGGELTQIFTYQQSYWDKPMDS